MRKILKCSIQITILLVAVNWVADFCLNQTDEFSVCRLQSALPNDPIWATQPLSSEQLAEFDRAMDQKYHYIGSGGQCFAFESEDRQHVIKFFKHRLRKPQTYWMSIPLPQSLAKRRSVWFNRLISKHYRDYNSYKLAYDHLREETALLAVHLNKTDNIGKILTITDKLHIEHRIDLDKTEFILQKKADLVYPTLEHLLEQGQLDQVKKAFHAIFELIVSRCQKGIFDEDPKIHCNVGLIGDKAIFIDVGRFKTDPERCNPQIYRQDLLVIAEKFKDWINQNNPSLIPLFEEELKQFNENS